MNEKVSLSDGSTETVRSWTVREYYDLADEIEKIAHPPGSPEYIREDRRLGREYLARQVEGRTTEWLENLPIPDYKLLKDASARVNDVSEEDKKKSLTSAGEGSSTPGKPPGKKGRQ